MYLQQHAPSLNRLLVPAPAPAPIVTPDVSPSKVAQPTPAATTIATATAPTAATAAAASGLLTLANMPLQRVKSIMRKVRAYIYIYVYMYNVYCVRVCISRSY